ncbi:MAG: hypothetical protein Ta2A_12030 [Treponemataceae bacterium]|nr:MAG: hypothetical protein Ta2A_12030 [Treponemataceae bacterium]
MSATTLSQNLSKKNPCRFGGRFDKYKVCRTDGKWSSKYGKDINDWDIAPPKEYFDELFRVSQKVIIWGGNYFDLPPSSNFIVWVKKTISENFSMAMAEYAWTNISGNAKVFEMPPQNKYRFHPTQKPVELYSFLIKHFAQDGDNILDTHLGSGSSRIAAHDMGYDFVGVELNETYFELQENRFTEHIAQKELFEFRDGKVHEMDLDLREEK